MIDYKSRLERLRQKAANDLNVDLLLLNKPSDIFYLSGVLCEGFLLISAEHAILYLPSVSYEEAIAILPDFITAEKLKTRFPVQQFKALAEDGKIAVDYSYLNVEDYFMLQKVFLDKIVSLGETVSAMRLIKDATEIELIKKACRAAAEIIDSVDVAKWMGYTEKDLAAYLENKARAIGLSGTAFTTIVAAGANSAFPHHVPNDIYIVDGWLKIDFGVVCSGYCSDLTRTYILDKFIGNLNAEKIYEVLKQSKEEAEKLLAPGARCEDVYAAAYNCLEREGYGKYFIHALGHGVGIDIHEKPYLKKNTQEIISEGMVLTIEPGVYFPGFGGMRIEDTYLITDKGAEQLTKTYQ